MHLHALFLSLPILPCGLNIHLTTRASHKQRFTDGRMQKGESTEELTFNDV